MFTIGEFSRITGLSIKTIRHYHELGLLLPHSIDPHTNYRYFSSRNVEEARTIQYLKELRLPLTSIQEVLSEFEDEAEILDFLERHRDRIEKELHRLEKASRRMNQIIERERKAQELLSEQSFDITKKEVKDQRIASTRWKGSYEETGKAFSLLFRRTRSATAGKPFNLYYDNGYMEDEADIESCLPLDGKRELRDVAVRTLAGGSCFSLIFRGPYREIGRAYERLTSHLKERAIEPKLPIREIYVKGPGLIFRGNPENYLTEIQMFHKEE